MEILFEILAEIFVEGALDSATSKKAPLMLRIAAVSLLAIVYGAMIGLFVFFIIKAIQQGRIALAIFIAIITIGFATGFIYILYDKLKKVKVKKPNKR
ncbi:MAG: hypothetical protein E7595_02225 [Ruminococcaceae bacterium]|nr:hypothetical protein [Oscillospiraceae bacterium]